MIIVAVGMVVILGFAALVVDLGSGYSQRRLAQNAADGGAMAAMRMVRMSPSETPGSTIYDEITRVAGLNGGAQVDPASTRFLDVDGNSLGPVDFYSGSLNQVAGVRVTTWIQYNTHFAGIVGVNSLTSGGKATAMSLAVNSITGTPVYPLAVPSHPDGDPSRNYDPDSPTPYTIWRSDNSNAAGNVGWLDFDGGNSPSGQLSNWLSAGFESSSSNQFTYEEYGSTPGPEHQSASLPVPCWVEGDTGLSNSSDVRTALNDMDELGGRSVTVLLFDSVEGNGSGARYRIVGFAQFRIVSVNTYSNPETVQARFERMVLSGDPSSTPTTGSMSTVRLTN